MTITRERMTTDQLASDFYARNPVDHFVTAAQTRFMADLFRRECGRNYDPRMEPQGVFAADGHQIGWHLHQVRGGAGKFATHDLTAIAVEEAYQERLRTLNAQIAAAGLAGDRAELERLMDESEVWLRRN